MATSFRAWASSVRAFFLSPDSTAFVAASMAFNAPVRCDRLAFLHGLAASLQESAVLPADEHLSAKRMGVARSPASTDCIEEATRNSTVLFSSETVTRMTTL